MSTAILFQANSGVAGDVNDLLNTVIESWLVDEALPPLAYGVPVKVVSNKIAAIESGDAATDFYGILSRSAPTVSGGVSIENSGQPNVNTTAGIVVGGPGYVLVKCTIGTPSRAGAVYMRVTEDLPALVGDLEAVADGVDNVLLANVKWALEGKDSNNVSAVRVN